ncbi:MAG: hypothetical protein HXY43_03485 [Fischerella sp.]|jgi:hypothetical protein|uniref:hypothetical protein n=1 Tax=unclassified Fischerella TaxID=494603 RepID=UPI00047C6F06|nr:MULTISPECIES: hypothetical protein [unclassified Fischerella]NWF58386.1 hypothetical protein [Fischerella sp.]
MNNTSNDLMAERLESLKGGIIAGFCLFLAFLITYLFHSLVLVKYFPILSSLQTEPLNWYWWLSCAIATFSGSLFGVTYRYIIRQDKNPQLQAGGVLAFGLIRGLTQVDIGVACADTIVPFIVLGLESVLWFAMAAIALNLAMQVGWLKPFSSNFDT